MRQTRWLLTGVAKDNPEQHQRVIKTGLEPEKANFKVRLPSHAVHHATFLVCADKGIEQ